MVAQTTRDLWRGRPEDAWTHLPPIDQWLDCEDGQRRQIKKQQQRSHIWLFFHFSFVVVELKKKIFNFQL